MRSEADLFQSALDARKSAYAPYSRFCVGAALETADGQIFCGCNVENASYSMTMCAERNAVFAAIFAGTRQFVRISVAGGADENAACHTPCYPCGACLQVLTEFCAPETVVILADGRHTLGEFFPKAFRFCQAAEAAQDDFSDSTTVI